MIDLSLLVSPRARSAYFNEALEVCRAELAFVGLAGEVQHQRHGLLDFFELQAEPEHLPALARLSFVQGLFERQGDQLKPLEQTPQFKLHEDFVFGAKYRGKTNETLTQLMINLGLAAAEVKEGDQAKVLDPMCGKGTTLLWALRYGLKSKGLEQDFKALGEIRQNVKKWCKIHRQKHQFSEGFVGQRNKQNQGKFVQFETEDVRFQAITGDAVQLPDWLKGETFHLLVADLPYGVGHHTTAGTRNPLKTLSACAPGWAAALKPGGAMVLAFNALQPRREALLEVFTGQGLEDLGFSAPHRMSESILRDLVVLKNPVRP